MQENTKKKSKSKLKSLISDMKHIKISFQTIKKSWGRIFFTDIHFCFITWTKTSFKNDFLAKLCDYTLLTKIVIDVMDSCPIYEITRVLSQYDKIRKKVQLKKATQFPPKS